MSNAEIKKIHKQMLLIIPSMLIFMVGDYCIGIEPSDSYIISGIISSGWLSIADWRITLSNITGLLGSIFYTMAALAFVQLLKYMLSECDNKWDKRFLKLLIVGLIAGCISFLYFHITCGTLIHRFILIFSASQGNTELAVSIWNRTYMTELIPYWVTFVAYELAVAIGWIVLVLRGVISLKKVWIIAAPIIVTGIGMILEAIIVLPFNGISAGFESLGWIAMFLGGVRYLKQNYLK